jgi:hypothetical protein
MLTWVGGSERPQTAACIDARASNPGKVSNKGTGGLCPHSRLCAATWSAGRRRKYTRTGTKISSVDSTLLRGGSSARMFGFGRASIASARPRRTTTAESSVVARTSSTSPNAADITDDARSPTDCSAPSGWEKVVVPPSVLFHTATTCRAHCEIFR